MRVKLFGGLEIYTNQEQSLKFTSLRAEILVAWLVMHPGQHRREMIASLLWDDRDQTRVLGNLRTLLARLPKPLKPYLFITTKTLGTKPEENILVDLLEFDRFMDASNYKGAEVLMTGEPLAGVHIEESKGLYEWMVSLREEYRQKGLNLLQNLAESMHMRRKYGQGVLYAHKLVQLDPLREESYRLLMRLLVHNGQKGEALNIFATCKQVLEDEFGIEPEPETITLAERLQSGQTPRHNLPTQPTPFVGRIEELALMQELLLSKDCRLISVVGAGGMGKTRIALECGQLLNSQFLDGVAFISLAGIDRPELVDVTIGSTLAREGFIPANTQNQPPIKYLQHHLKDKEMLLILDNYEHLLESAPLLSELLGNCIDLNLLVTSRARLGLNWEHLVELHGLQYSSDLNDENWQMSDAVRLFLQTTRQIIPDLTLTAVDRQAVTEICEVVGSMPLALELAAKWVRIHSCWEILTEIRKNVEFLVNADRDVPERHRSILAVFEYSWAQLTIEEQNCLARMSVFRGHFDFPAAKQITKATRSVLTSLIDHSLLNRIQPDTRQSQVRFELHYLLREFALRKLALSPNALEAVQQSHIRYYLKPLIENGVEKSESKTHANQTIRADLDNIRAAWDRAVKNYMGPLLFAASKPLSLFWQHEGFNQEGANSLRRAVKAAAESQPNAIVLELRLELIQFLRNLACYDEAIVEIEEAIRLIDEGEESQLAAAKIYLLWGEILIFRSTLDTAEEKLSKSLEIASRLEDTQLIGQGFRLVGLVAYYRGDMQEAEKAFRRAYQIFQGNSDLQGIAATQNNLGMVCFSVGQKLEAIDWYKKAVTSWEKEGDLQAMLRGLTNLGHCLVQIGRFKEALATLERVQTGLKESGKIRGEGHASKNKGLALTSLGQFEKAEKCLKYSLILFQRAGTKSDEATSKIYLATLYQSWGKREAARIQVEAAHKLALKSGNKSALIAALISLGYISLNAGDAAKAWEAFDQALQIQEQLKRALWMHESLAGLAAVALLTEEETKAQALLLPHAEDLSPSALQVALQPFAVILTYTRVLQTCEPGLAKQTLKMGLEMLYVWEKAAPDEASRETFRTAVPSHRALLEYADQFSDDSNHPDIK